MSTFSLIVSLLCLGQAPADEQSLKALHRHVQNTHVKLTDGPKLTLVTAPVFRYSDELRHIKDAGIWIWTDRGRPAAVEKVEHYEPGVLSRPWLYCFVSLSPGLLTAEWKGSPTFQSHKPGVIWKGLEDKPATTRTARLVQMREIARRFSAELVEPNATNDAHQMRLIPRPLYRYDEGLADAEDGAIFGFTGTGTNPDLLLLLDLSKEGWRHGLAGMTAAGLTVRLDDKVVWEIPHGGGKGLVFDTWTYFAVADE